MSTILDIKQWIASYMGLTAVTDLNPSSFSPNPGINMDLGLIGINSARRLAERAHDFKYAEANVFLSIPSTGANINSSYQNTNVTVTGTLSPNVTGSWALSGVYSGFPFYTIVAGGVQYFLYNNGSGTNQWIIAFNFDGGNAGGNYWDLSSTSATPEGTYTHHGTYTGSPVVANTTGLISVKHIEYVTLPVAGGGYQPIEFLTNDDWLARVQMQIGRQEYNPSLSLLQMGYVGLPNPTAYLQSNNLYLTGRQITYPIIAQLNVTRWMPDYTTDTDTDFFTQYAPEFLQWQGLLEVNKVFRRYAPKQEGNIDEAAVQSEASAALQSLIEWDISTVRGSTTPDAQAPASGSQPPAQAQAPAQAA